MANWCLPSLSWSGSISFCEPSRDSFTIGERSAYRFLLLVSETLWSSKRLTLRLCPVQPCLSSFDKKIAFKLSECTDDVEHRFAACISRNGDLKSFSAPAFNFTYHEAFALRLFFSRDIVNRTFDSVFNFLTAMMMAFNLSLAC